MKKENEIESLKKKAKSLFKLFFLVASITVFFKTSVNAQATLTFETAVRPLGSELTNSEGNSITADAFQIPSGLAFSNDGRKVFASNFVQNKNANPNPQECVRMMTLSTPFDLRTVSLVVDEASPLVTKVGLTDNSNDSKCSDIKFSRDGLKLFLGNVTGKIHGFDLAQPFDLNGLTYSDNVSSDLTNGTNGGRANFSFSNDGKKLIFLDGTQEQQHIDEYSLSTAYDLTSITLVNTITLTTTANLGAKDQGHAVEFSQDGMTMFVLMHDGDALQQTDKDAIFQFSLTQSFSTRTATMVGSVTPTGRFNTGAYGMTFSPTGNKLYLVNRIGSQEVSKYVDSVGGSVDVVTQIGLSCDYGLVACVSDPRSSLGTQIQLAKNSINENSSIIFKRFEWIKRNKNNNNFNNLAASIKLNNPVLNNWYDKFQDKALVQKASLKEKSSKDKKNNWSYWSHGDISVGSYNRKLGEEGITLEKPKDIYTTGITFGVDKKDNENNFSGYAIRYSDGKSKFASSGHRTTMDALSLNYYMITPLKESGYTNTVVGLSTLKYDLNTGGVVTGQRNGKQLFTSIDFRNDNEYGSFNLTPSLKIKHAITSLSGFTEFMTNSSSAGTNVIYEKETFFTGDLATGVLFNSDPVKYGNKIISNNGGLEFVYDYSPDITFEYSYAGSSKNELYNVEKYSKKNIRANYGIETVYQNNFTISINYETLQHLDSNKYSNTDSFFLKVGRIKEEDYEFDLSFDALQDYKVSTYYLTKLDKFDLKIESNYNFISVVPEYGVILEISNNF